MATVIEFYKISLLEEEDDLFSGTENLTDKFKRIVGKDFAFNNDIYPRDLYKTQEIDGYICAVFRKFRTGEAITVGKTCEPGRDVELDENEGKFETNHFIFVPNQNIICYIRNVNANYYLRLEECLKSALQANISLLPLYHKETIQELLSNKKAVLLDFTIPINKDLMLDKSDNWSDNMLSEVQKSGGDTAKIEISCDIRKSDYGTINKVRDSIKSILANNPSRAKVKLVDIDGNSQTIDILGNAIRYHDNSYTYTKDTLTNVKIFNKIITSYLSKKDEIDKVV